MLTGQETTMQIVKGRKHGPNCMEHCMCVERGADGAGGGTGAGADAPGRRVAPAPAAGRAAHAIL
jgi:hypothetical protein